MPSEANLTERFKSWNPMQDDYTNSQFNQYSSGPGAGLDPALQPGELAKRRIGSTDHAPTAPVPYLVLKHVPKGMTKNAILNICERHGRVLGVRDSTKNDYIFVDLASISDMESVYRALEHNSFGFHVLVGKQFKKKPDVVTSLGPERVNNTQQDNPIDFESRTYRSSNRNPPRPQFTEQPFVSAKNYDSKDSLLKRNDPQRHFLIENDAHALERAGLQQPPGEKQEKKYNYCAGRAYINMPNKTKQFIEDKNRQSVGQFNAEQQSYKNNNNGRKLKVNIGKCVNCSRACDLVCARCSTYFCGIECRREAWPKHRYICGKSKTLRSSSDSTTDDDILRTNCNTINLASKPKSKLSDIKANATTTAQKSLASKPESKLSDIKVNVTTTAQKSLASKPESRLPDIKANATTTAQKSLASEPPQLAKERPIPRSGNLVRLTAISKANVVFIRSKTYEDNVDFFKTIHEVQSLANDLKPCATTPACGQIVLAHFKHQLSRAMVLNADNAERIKLVYIDYGNLDMRKLSELYVAPDKFVELPRFAIPVILKGVPDCYMTEQIRTFMYSYLDGIDLVLKYKSNEDFIAEKGVHCVELIDESTNQSFNKVVAKLCKAVEPTDANEVYFADYLTQTLLPAGENIELVVMDNSLLCTGCLSCTTEAYAVEIAKFQKELQKYAEALEPQSYTPRVSELCIAKYVDGKWYRGRCLEIVGDAHPSIVFFDYGNIAMVNIKDIRRYPAQFTFPIYTCDCEIKGLPEQCSDELVAKLEKLIPNGSAIRCDSVCVYEEDKFHAITMSKIIQQLKADGLLQEEEI